MYSSIQDIHHSFQSSIANNYHILTDFVALPALFRGLFIPSYMAEDRPSAGLCRGISALGTCAIWMLEAEGGCWVGCAASGELPAISRALCLKPTTDPFPLGQTLGTASRDTPRSPLPAPRSHPCDTVPLRELRTASSAPRLPIIAVILVGGEVLPDLPVGLPYPLAEALELAAQRAAESGEIRLHAASGAALRHAAARPAPRCAAPRGGASARCCFFSTTDSGSRGPGPRGDLCFS